MSKSILVIGTGTIGEPLIGLLADVREQIGVDEIMFHKHSPLLADRPKVSHLTKRGAKLCVNQDAMAAFEDLGHRPSYEKVEAIDRADVIIDCTPKGWGRQNKKDYYERFEKNTLGFIAQGSEFGFGKMYVRGLNDRALVPGNDKYIQVVSCNTHNIAILIDSIALGEGENNLAEGRFVCIRRANDISQDSSFIPSPLVNEHDDATFGTHHARDAYHLFRTLGLELNLFSSALKLNTQYMHAIWFDLTLKRPITLATLEERFAEHQQIAVTHKKLANLVFSFGRDHGHYGRILNNTVIVLPTLHIRGGNEVLGFCFTPQDGNSILSSVAAALWLLDPESYEERLSALNPFFYNEV